MKIVCNKSDLVKGVNIVSKAVPGKTTMPILECILIDATTDIIKLTANDMELGIQTEIAGEIIDRGMIAIDAKIFSEIVRKLPDNEVSIETDDRLQTTIVCEKAKFDISGKPGNEFAYLPIIEKDDSIAISQFTLKEVIRQTIFSIADTESNKLMTGELFEIKDNVLRVASLDGHRISIRKIELKNPVSDYKMVVPGKTLIEISKILSGEAESMVEISYTNNHIVFEFDNTIVVSRLIEGEYFKIDQMLSSDYDTKVRINKKEFLNCIDRATLLIKEGDKKCKIETSLVKYISRMSTRCTPFGLFATCSIGKIDETTQFDITNDVGRCTRLDMYYLYRPVVSPSDCFPPHTACNRPNSRFYPAPTSGQAG